MWYGCNVLQLLPCCAVYINLGRVHGDAPHRARWQPNGAALSRILSKSHNLIPCTQVREAVVGTAYAAVGAPAAGLLIASWLDNWAEDVAVLGAAGAAAYLSVINLPLRFVCVTVLWHIALCMGAVPRVVAREQHGQMECAQPAQLYVSGLW